MHKSSTSRQLYRALLRLYPRAHRRDYAEQMLQTFDDMLADRHSPYARAGLWLRIGRELPLNIVQEHISNTEGKDMSKLISSKLLIIGASLIIVVGIAVGGAMQSGGDYSPVTYAALQRPAGRPTCLQPHDITALGMSKTEYDALGNVVASSITDASAGTNVDIDLKTYQATTVTGTAVYGGKYGDYNFVAKKVPSEASNTFTRGWVVTKFEACKP